MFERSAAELLLDKAGSILTSATHEVAVETEFPSEASPVGRTETGVEVA